MTKQHTKEEHTNALAQYLPNGRLFEAKNINDSNFRQLLRGLAGELFTAEGYLVTLEQEYFPDTTVLFIEEWEQALGIPDSCFSGTGDLDERRRDIVVKLASLGVQTVNDFVNLADTFGKTITITYPAESPYPPYDIPYTPVGFPEARFIMIVSGENIVTAVPPYDIPLFLSTGETVLECLFNKLIPSNTKVIFVNTN